MLIEKLDHKKIFYWVLIENDQYLEHDKVLVFQFPILNKKVGLLKSKLRMVANAKNLALPI
jgi:hypothetical protein